MPTPAGRGSVPRRNLPSRRAATQGRGGAHNRCMAASGLPKKGGGGQQDQTQQNLKFPFNNSAPAVPQAAPGAGPGGAARQRSGMGWCAARRRPRPGRSGRSVRFRGRSAPPWAGPPCPPLSSPPRVFPLR